MIITGSAFCYQQFRIVSARRPFIFRTDHKFVMILIVVIFNHEGYCGSSSSWSIYALIMLSRSEMYREVHLKRLREGAKNKTTLMKVLTGIFQKDLRNYYKFKEMNWKL